MALDEIEKWERRIRRERGIWGACMLLMTRLGHGRISPGVAGFATSLIVPAVADLLTQGFEKVSDKKPSFSPGAHRDKTQKEDGASMKKKSSFKKFSEERWWRAS